MKEFEFRVPDQGLTRQPGQPTLRSEGNFMSDETGGENIRPADEAAETSEPSEEVLALRWAKQNPEYPWEKVIPEVKKAFKEAQPKENPPERKRVERLPTRDEFEGYIQDVRKGRFRERELEDLVNKILDADITSGITEEQLLNMSRDERRAVRDNTRAKEAEKALMSAQIADEVMQLRIREGRVDPRKEILVRNLREAVKAKRYDDIEYIIERELHSDEASTTYAEVVRRVVDELQGREGGEYDPVLEDLMEYGVERILSRADADAKSPYPRFNLYEEMNLDAVIHTARVYDERAAEARGERPSYRVFQYLSTLRSKRHAMHELFRGMKSRKTYVDLVTELLRKDGMAFVEKQIAGVADIQIIYEQVLASKLGFSKDWLNGDDFAEADDEAMRALSYSMKDDPGNYQKKFVKREGREGHLEYAKRELRPWELRRAFFVGRSMGAASMRRLVYGVLGDLPLRDPRSIKSIEFEFMARIFGIFKLIPWRFFYHPIARIFLDRMVHEKKRKSDGKIDHFKYGYMKDGKDRGLYNKSQYALAIVDTGATDPKTNGWRARNLFLEQKDFRAEKLDGKWYAIGNYLDEVKLSIEEELKEEARAAGHLKGKDWQTERNLWEVFLAPSEKYHYKKEIKRRFNEKVRRVIAEQRLFLGTLMRHYDLDDANKAAIWTNVANLLPSRMAAFFPEETLEAIKQIYGTGEDKAAAKTVWDVFKMRLWLIERARVKKDAEILNERSRTRGRTPAPTKQLEDYYQGQGAIIQFDAKEIALVKALQKIGINHVVTDEKGNPITDEEGNPTVRPDESAKGGLVRMTFPFTAFLDDAPKTDWEELEDEDYDRLLVNDHSHFEKGHSEIVSLIASPSKSPKEVAQHLNNAFDSIEQPLGRPKGQEYMEAYVNAYLPIARQNGWADWFGWPMKVAMIPRSDGERRNIASEMVQDEKGREQIIKALAAHETLNSDEAKADKNGKTQYIRVLERNKAERKYQILRWARILLQILGPIAGKEFLKVILPPNLAKDLGI